MEFAAASVASTQWVEFAVNAHGTKSTTKVLESAEYLVTQKESSISANKLVFAYLSTSNYPTEPATPAQSTQPMIPSPRLVCAIRDTF